MYENTPPTSLTIFSCEGKQEQKYDLMRFPEKCRSRYVLHDPEKVIEFPLNKWSKSKWEGYDLQYGFL